MSRLQTAVGIVALCAAVGCGDEPSEEDPFAGPGVSSAGQAGDTGSDDDDDADAVDDDGDDGASSDDGGMDPGDDGAPADGGAMDDPPVEPAGLCHLEPPAGAPSPPSPKSYSGGSCPAIAPGYNTGFTSDGRSREFMLVVPSNHDASKQYPLVFAWYHITGNAMDFIEYIDVQKVADERQMILVVPQDSGMFEATWPMTPLDNDQASVDLVFFDDLLSCISEQFSVNANCVASAGVSAGGLWTAFLGQRRGKWLSSNLVFSGGYPTEFGQYWWNWQESPHTFASLVLWGGPNDQLGINFHQASLNYKNHLAGDGHYIVSCQHDNGHGAPPPDAGETEPPVGALFDFVLDHPYWYEGVSPYQTEGAPADLPSYCSLP